MSESSPKGSVSDFVMTSGSNLNTPQQIVMKTYNASLVAPHLFTYHTPHATHIAYHTESPVVQCRGVGNLVRVMWCAVSWCVV